MKHRAALALLATIAFPLFAWGAVPAPPVNQDVGLPDSVFDAFSEAACRTCHNSNPPPGVPVDPTYLPDRHHLLVGTELIPPGTAAPRGIVGQTYQCTDCHTLQWNPAAGRTTLVQDFRNCVVCHVSLTDAAGNVLGTVHHRTRLAQSADCVSCHGTFVDNPDDGHRIPTYAISLITPWPSGKPNPGPRGEGNCTFCHATGTGDGTPGIDPGSQVRVYDSRTTHHRTGFGADPSKCLWCHETSAGATTIRTCQNCHGIDSLHNIQVESPDPDTFLKPGSEWAGYGHIGHQDDCTGCHGFSTAASLASFPQRRVVPTLERISKGSVPAGVATSVFLTGSAFVTSFTDPVTGKEGTVTSKVLLVDRTGNRIRLDPVSQQTDRMEVVLPPYLSSGLWRLTVVKEDQASNPVVLGVTPTVDIYSARRLETTVTVRGSGFGAYLPEADAGVRITGWRRGEAGAETARIDSWMPNRIVATFSTPVDTVEVTTLFHAATATVTEAAPYRPLRSNAGRLSRLLSFLTRWRYR